MTRRRVTTSAILLGPALAAVLSGSAAVAAQVYDITDLGANFQPLGLNESGLISGVDSSAATPTAVLYRDGILIPLQNQSYALAANENQLVVGYQDNSPDNTALLWSDTQLASELSPFSSLLEARDISSFDEVIGVRQITDGFERGFSYDIYSGTLTTLGTLGGGNAHANAINDRGHITGASADVDDNMLAFRYDTETLINLDTFDGYRQSEGLDINENHDVVGLAYNRNVLFGGRRAFYAPVNSGIFNLGALNHDVDSIARGINNDGFIVGQSVRFNGDKRAFSFDTSANDTLLIITDPQGTGTVYTGSSNGNGVARSFNSGEDWLNVNLGLVNRTINGLSIDPDTSARIYAATNGGIFVSNNSGSNWFSLHQDLSGFTTYALHVDNAVREDEDEERRMYAGTARGIFYSHDNGDTWDLAPETSNFGSFVFASDPDPDNELVYAATSSGLYRSINGGASWSQANGQDETRLFTRFLTMVLLDENEPGVLYVGTRGGGIYKATQITQDIQFEPINDGLLNVVINDLIIDTDSNPSILYTATNDGFYRRSTDLVSDWEKLRDGATFSSALADEGGATKTLYITTPGSIFRSENGGASWASVTPGISSSDVYTFQVIRDLVTPTQSRIFAGTANGIYSTRANDAVADALWSIADSGTSGFKITSIAVDGDNYDPPRLWAGSTDQGLYVSVDDGQNWIRSNTGLDNYNIQALAVDTTTFPPIVYAATLGGVYVSTDAGSNWAALNNGLTNLSVYSLALDIAATPKILYAGTADGVYRSSDQGRNWVPVSIGLPDDVDIVDLAINPNNDDQIIAASASEGLYRSLDQGLSWTSLNTNSTVSDNDIFDIAQHPGTPGTFLVAAKNGVHRISDAFGAWSWAAINSGIDGLSVYSVAYNPDASTELFAGVDTDGVYKSTDDGASWSLMSNGLESLTNKMVALDTQVERPEWQLQDATAIDNMGRIVGTGLLNGTSHGYLLTPVLGTASADVALTMTSTPETLKANIPMTFEITITNNGPDAANDVQFTDWLPPNVLYRHSAASQGVCSAATSAEPPLLRCNIGVMDVGDSVNVSISLEPQQTELQIRNIARVKANEHDPDFSNNTVGENRTITIDECFIATAAYGSFLHPYVTELRAFRDDYLLSNRLGRWFVDFYYEHSPPIAARIAEDETLRWLARLVLAPLVYTVMYPGWAFTGVLLLLTGYGYRRRHVKQWKAYAP